jgi:hypothetical protein
VSVPDGVDKMREICDRVTSVLERYKGTQLRSVLRGGIGFDGGVGTGSGIAFSRVVSGGGRPWISDIFGYNVPWSWEKL